MSTRARWLLSHAGPVAYALLPLVMLAATAVAVGALHVTGTTALLVGAGFGWAGHVVYRHYRVGVVMLRCGWCHGMVEARDLGRTGAPIAWHLENECPSDQAHLYRDRHGVTQLVVEPEQ